MTDSPTGDFAGEPVAAQRTLYDVLGVGVDASAAVIKSRYRQLVKELHPDAAGTTIGSAQLIEVNHAWEVLGDPRRRVAYDSEVLGIRKANGASLLTPETLDQLARQRVERWRKVAAAGFHHVFPAPLDWPGFQALWPQRTYSWWERELRRLPKASPYLLRLESRPGAEFEALDHLDRDELILLWKMPRYDALDAHQLAHVSGHVALVNLELPYSQITDAGVAAVGPLPQLRLLNLFGNRLTSASLPSIAECPELLELNLGGNPIDDVSALAGLKKLRYLDLRRTQVSEDAVLALGEMPALEHLDVDGSWRTRRRLREALPGVRVV